MGILIASARGSKFIRPGDLTAAYAEALERRRYRALRAPPPRNAIPELAASPDQVRARLAQIRRTVRHGPSLDGDEVEGVPA